MGGLCGKKLYPIPVVRKLWVMIIVKVDYTYLTTQFLFCFNDTEKLVS